MKERSAKQGLQQAGVYSLISLLVWQPILVRADVARSELPQASADWVSQGTATRIETGNNMTVNQTSDRVSLRWESFNVGADAAVNFNQPNSNSIALNKVVGGGSAASRIEGRLSANGIIYIIDSNGVIFGQNSVVEVASLIASALDVDEDLIMNESFVKAINESKAAFEGGAAENAAIVLEASLDGTEGARIITGKGGSVFLFAPRVETQKGSNITTPDGQTILAAAKDKVYLAASQDPDLRGILVEVNSGGDIDHAGKIIADRGNITLAALNIDQKGELTATTSVDANGTIRLLARDTVNENAIGAMNTTNGNRQSQLAAGALMADGELAGAMTDSQSGKYAKATEAGRIIFHEGSVTRVVPDSSKQATADSNAQPVSFVEAMGKTIDVNDGANIISRGGVVQLLATDHPDSPAGISANSSEARVTLHDGSVIDVSGMRTAEVDMERNSLEIELRGDELKDSPLQRNDPDIRGETAYVDIRDTDEIKFANISAYLAKIERTVDERLAAGGTVNIVSEGVADFQQGAKVDVSGGSVKYRAGYVLESQLVDDGNLVYISDADPNRNYDAVLTGSETYNARWNVVEKIKSSSVGAGKGTFVEAYEDGKDAGSFNITGKSLGYAGVLVADTVAGPYQRTDSQQPNGGKLLLDLSYFDSGVQQSVALVSQQTFLEFLEAQLAGDTDAEVMQIAVNSLKNTADSITIKSRGTVTLESGTTLNLDGGGTLKLTGGDVNIEGDIINHGGDVAINAREYLQDTRAHQLNVADGVTIDTSGKWVNDNPLLKADPSARIRIEGGNISLESDGSVVVGEQAHLIANGGAWADAKGKVKGGKGGDISLNADRFEYGGELDYRGDASSYSLTQGGKLSLTGSGFTVGQDIANVEADTIGLTPEFFQQGGFGAVELSAGNNGIRILPGTQIDLIGKIYQLGTDNILNVASADKLNRVVNVIDSATLPAAEHAVVDLSLNSAESAITIGSTSDGIWIGAGAEIKAEPGAAINLSSTGGGIDLAGTIVAKGGNVSLQVTPSAFSPNTLDSSLAIRLRQGSLIDVGAVASEGYAEASGVRPRRYFEAGAINVDAAAGYILSDSGSELRANGTTSQYDYYDGRYHQVVSNPVAMDAGSISLSATEGMFLNGDMSASAANGGRAGSLDIKMSTEGRLVDTNTAQWDSSFKDYELEIRVDDHGVDAASMAQIMDAQNIVSSVNTSGNYSNGVAFVDVNTINAGGFASVGLHTFNDLNRQSKSDPLKTESRITFASNTALQASEAIRLETPALTVQENAASVTAPYVAIGTATSDSVSSQTGTVLSGVGSFTAEADFIDLVGDITFLDADVVSLKSHGDIRLRGVREQSAINTSSLKGSLTTGGDLDLLAAQIYSATASDYTFNLPATESTVTIRNHVTESDGDFKIDEPYAVYSAQGSVTVNADHIIQDGTLKAPFGSIHLNGRQTLTLEDGSLTSVAGEGQTVLFGEVEADGTWLYSAAAARPVVSVLDEKNIELTSPAIAHKEGATVDISGDGDLLAYEFVPGPGGSLDALNYSALGGGGAGETFAIVPTYGSKWAAYDAVEMSDFPYQIGDTIRFENGAGLDPNITYAVLPARYALLPGAMLVTPQNNITQPGLNSKTEWGASIVAGKLGNAGSDLQDSLWSAFVVEPGSVALTRSEFKQHFASDFFAAEGTRPQDAGRIVYNAIDALAIDGAINAVTSTDGVGGRLDVVANDIRVVGSHSESSGGIELLAENLEKLNVDSLLLGGTRATSVDGTTINTGAQKVSIAGDVDLTISELILAATDSVNMENGAQISATRSGHTAGGEVLLSGDGVLLQASVGEALEVRRQGAGGNGGSINIMQGASVFGQGALVLDATGSALLQGDIDTTGTAAFSSARLVLGAESVNSGMALSQSALNGLSARELKLASLADIEITSDFSISVNRLTLDAAAIKSSGNTPVTASISAADSISLQNSTGHEAAATTGAGGTLQLVGQTIEMLGADDGASSLALSGFNTIDLVANETVSVGGGFTLLVDGDLNIATPRIQAGSGADFSAQATGDLQVTGNASSLPAALAGLGAYLNFQGENVTLDTAIRAASGKISLEAESDLTVGSHAIVDVSGIAMDFAGDTVTTNAGNIELRSNQGNILTQSGSILDLSAPSTDANSGTLLLSASAGNVELNSDLIVQRYDQSTGGNVKVDIAQGANFLTLQSQFADFAGAQEWRARQGDIAVQSGQTVQAKAIKMSADSGNVIIDGNLNAEGKEAGSIALYAGQDVRLGSSAKLLANATQNEKDGGSVLLSSRQGSIDLSNASVIEVKGNGSGRGGNVEFQTTRSENNVDVDFADNGVQISGADRVSVTGFKRYETDFVDQAYLNDEVQPDTAEFMAAMQTLIDDVSGKFSHLVADLGAVFEVSPGVELYSSSDLITDGDLNLAPSLQVNSTGIGSWNDSWRFGDSQTPGSMRFVADGNIYVGGSISDGYLKLSTALGNIQTAPIELRSWNFEFVAGADSSAANAMSVLDAGTMDVAENSLIRTGTGDIGIAVGGDLTLQDGSAIYTGGRSDYYTDENRYLPESGSLYYKTWNAVLVSGRKRLMYGHDGGDVNIDVGHDLVAYGAPVNSTDWLFRVDAESNNVYDMAGNKTSKYISTWGTYFEGFKNGVGTLGGGDVSVRAGNDVSNLLLVASTTGTQVGAIGDSATNEVLVRGGGDVLLQAGHNVLSGQYVVGKGDLNVEAGGKIAKADDNEIASSVLFGDASISLNARNAIEITRVMDQGLVPISAKQSTQASQQNLYFSEQSADSLSVRSLSGDVQISPDSRYDENIYTGLTTAMHAILPAKVEVVATDGSIEFSNISVLESHSDNALAIYAADDISWNPDASLRIAGAAGELMPYMGTAYSPAVYSSDNASNTNFLGLLGIVDNSVLLLEGMKRAYTQPVETPLRLVTLDGDIWSDGQTPVLQAARETEIVSGGDIRNAPLMLTNNFASDVSVVRAQGDIVVESSRSETGVIQGAALPAITIDGPGTLLVTAGGDINLGASDGILSRGDIVNTALADTGADILALAGITGSPDFSSFADAYIKGDDTEGTLNSFLGAAFTDMTFSVGEITSIVGGQTTGGKFTESHLVVPADMAKSLSSSDIANVTSAQELFLTLSRSDRVKVAQALYENGSDRQRQVLVYNTLLNEVKRGGYEDSVKKSLKDFDVEADGFRRSFSAIEKLFPEDQSWKGNLSLVFSSINTQDGGDIGIITPGGGVDVGLPIQLPGVTKGPAQLGLIATRAGDLNVLVNDSIRVNQSRTFALDGDIMMWASEGDIDAGRGAKTANGASRPNVTIDSTGKVTVDYGAVVNGSGIRASDDVSLFAPAGVIDAGDAGIGARGNVILAAQQIVGADNIDVGGVSIGVPLNTGVSAGVMAAGSIGSSANSSGMGEVAEQVQEGSESSAQQVAFLTVEIIGLGD